MMPITTSSSTSVKPSSPERSMYSCEVEGSCTELGRTLVRRGFVQVWRSSADFSLVPKEKPATTQPCMTEHGDAEVGLVPYPSYFNFYLLYLCGFLNTAN